MDPNIMDMAIVLAGGKTNPCFQNLCPCMAISITPILSGDLVVAAFNQKNVYKI
jgi:hypothetical protein